MKRVLHIPIAMDGMTADDLRRFATILINDMTQIWVSSSSNGIAVRGPYRLVEESGKLVLKNRSGQEEVELIKLSTFWIVLNDTL